MTQRVFKVGSSAAVAIPKKSLKELGLKIGDEVRVDINRKTRVVIIEPVRKIKKEVLDWTDRFIKQYRSALESLAEK